MENVCQYENKDLYSIYRGFDGPKFYWIYKYNDETKEYEYLKLIQAETAAWKDGYNVVTYYQLLSNRMSPTVRELFKKVYQQVEEIGELTVISRDQKKIRDYFTAGYKPLEDFIKENYVYYSANPTMLGKLTKRCMDSITIDDDVLRSGYNAYQKQINENAKSGYTGSNYKIKEDEAKFLDIVEKSNLM